MARHFGARPDDVEDLAQEALLKFLTYRGAIVDPVAWLFVVIRRLQRRRSRWPERLPHRLPVIDPWPEVELRIDTQRLLQSISERGRHSIGLSLAGFTERETAQRLGCSVKATEKSLHKTRRKLRRLLRG